MNPGKSAMVALATLAAGCWLALAPQLALGQDRGAWGSAHSSRMNPGTLDSWSEDRRAAWAREKLGHLERPVLESARRNRIPPRLLATCILNELADYNLQDQAQEYIPNAGSVGIAQINVITAIEHDLVDLPESELDEAANYYLEQMLRGAVQAGGSNVRISPDLRRSMRQQAEQQARVYLTWQKLNDPLIAVEAAAREISLIFDRLNKNLRQTWPASLLTGPIDRADPFRNLKSDEPLERDAVRRRINQERSMALLVCAAYNSQAIVSTPFPLSSPYHMAERREPFANARNHGVNGMDLFAGLLAAKGWYLDAQPILGDGTLAARLVNRTVEVEALAGVFQRGTFEADGTLVIEGKDVLCPRARWWTEGESYCQHCPPRKPTCVSARADAQHLYLLRGTGQTLRYPFIR